MNRALIYRRQLIRNFRMLILEYRKDLLDCLKLLKFRRRLKSATEFSKKHHFEKLTRKMNQTMKEIMLTQICEAKEKLKGQQFTLDEKIMCLSLYQENPRSYGYLRKLFILPSKCTLNKLIEVIKVGPVIRSQIFQLIKEEMSVRCNNRDQEKYCSIVFDKVSLKPHLTNDSDDKTDGCVDLNQEKSSSRADYAMTFILHGAVSQWCQPVAFYHCEKSPSQHKLMSTIEDIVKNAVAIGLVPIALVTVPAFQPVINALQVQYQRFGVCDYTVNMSEIILNVIYNPRHLMEEVRNNFLTKNICLNDKIAKWTDIMAVYYHATSCRIEPNRPSPLLPSVRDEHVIPEKIQQNAMDKNKYYCLQVLSQSMAAILSFTSKLAHCSDGLISLTMKDTAQVVHFFGSLYDSASGTKLVKKKFELKFKPVNTAVTKNSQHLKFWLEARAKLENMKFINESNEAVLVPALEHWKITVNSLQNIVEFLQSKNVRIIYPGYFNCDSIDIFYDHMHGYNSWDDDWVGDWDYDDNYNDAIVNKYRKCKPLLVTNFNVHNYEETL